MTHLTHQAIDLLKQGKLIGLPTETVYGLAGDAKNDAAIKKIFSVKGRPADHPLIVHIGTIAEINDWAEEVSPTAQKLIETFWPGPLTLILKKQKTVSPLLTAHQDSIGLRMPNHPLALEILRGFGSALAAPSANQFGHISPTRAEDVFEELRDQVALILPGGQAAIGIESTIVDARSTPITILRQGAITQAMLEHTLEEPVIVKAHDTELKVSGNLPSHYAPHTPLKLMDTKTLEKFAHEDARKIIFILHSHLAIPGKIIHLDRGAEAYAHDLYASLRRADHEAVDLIVVETPPTGGLWDAIHDRLARAASQ